MISDMTEKTFSSAKKNRKNAVIFAMDVCVPYDDAIQALRVNGVELYTSCAAVLVLDRTALGALMM